MPDEDGFRRWAEERQLALLRTAVLLTGDRQRAEDLVQEALTQVALRWRRLADEHPDAYARQVIVRRNISWWRKHRREVVADVPDLGASTGAEASADRRMLLDLALDRLSPRQRATVVLRYYDDLSERETADVLGVSVGTVKSQTHVALRRLREASPELADLLGEDSR
ncbi:SigE family RNA polymerase sigma factor [Nocardioides hankookensis]|uniref:SigE family RNA polymerase sigma factor n=1 Tax=Nocardioides hankookensis TaxID=443157 RepID=A0ABW1LMJ8_9ACTN